MNLPGCKEIIGGLLVALALLAGPAAMAQGLTIPLRAAATVDAPVSQTVRLYGKSYALIIGNDAYGGAWPRLSNAVKDARLVAEALRAKGFEVTLKTDLNYRDLVDALETFFLEVGQDPDARLFLWYAGHGYTERGESYLVPTDAPDPSVGGAFLRKALSLRRMGEYVRDSAALHILSVFDACFAGTIFSTSRAKPPPAITRATTRPVRQFLTSGDAGQEVSDDGTFRKLFIRAINGENRADANGDGYLAATELGLFMSNAITNYSDGNQTPRSGKLNDPDWDQGDFVFRLTATAPVRVAAAPPVSAPPAVTRGGTDKEVLFWQSIQNSTSIGDFEAYLEQFPAGTFAPLARSRVKTLRSRDVAVLKPSKPMAMRAKSAPSVRRRPGEVFRDCAGCPEMVALPRGVFRMGDISGGGRNNEKPVRSVRIAKPFAVGKYEVTRGEYAAFAAATGRGSGDGCFTLTGGRWQISAAKGWRDPGYAQTDRDPVTCVNWDDARAYAAWLGGKTGQSYRLPSEAEWEYAARAGTASRYAFGNDREALCRAGNGADRNAPFGWRNAACDDSFATQTAPVGSFASNDFGLYDIHGNVWEWVGDCWNARYAGAPSDGSAWTGGDCGKRVLRGGSWDARPDNLRSAFRTADKAGVRYNFVGFRLARSY